MATTQELEVITRAVILRHAQRQLEAMPRRTPEYAKQLTLVKTIQRQLDEALDRLAPEALFSSEEVKT